MLTFQGHKRLHHFTTFFLQKIVNELSHHFALYPDPHTHLNVIRSSFGNGQWNYNKLRTEQQQERYKAQTNKQMSQLFKSK